MISPRTTRLVRVADLQAFRGAIVALACEGAPLDARHRLVVVPTRAAAAHLLRTIEDEALAARGAVLLPDLVTPGELVARLTERLDTRRRVLTDAEREVLLGAAARGAREAGAEPPFRLRPGLIAEILRFYDALRRNLKDVATFERLALGVLEPGATYDRGAERLVRQTRFLVATFRDFEQRCAVVGVDEHHLRQILVTAAALRPFRHVVVTVTDRAFDPHGLSLADWDLLARLPGLERLDVVVTDTVLAGALHERIHRVLPGIEEVRFDRRDPPRLPVLVIPSPDPFGGAPARHRAGVRGGDPGLVHTARDREEEVAGFARRVKQASRAGEVTSLDRIALVVRQPLPYVYVAREVLRSAGIPCQLFDALPLAAEPYAAAVDLVFSFVAASFARVPGMALLGSPHFRFCSEPLEAGRSEGGPHIPKNHVAESRASENRVTEIDVVALDRALGEAGYLGEVEALEQLIESWRAASATHGRMTSALRAGEMLLRLARELAPLRAPAAAAVHLSTLLEFLAEHEQVHGLVDPLRARQLRARAAILGTLQSLRDAYRSFDDQPVDFDTVAALLRRWIEGQTFVPRAGESGVHVVDAESARFGAFDFVQVAGVVEGEWPDAPRRNVFYSSAVLRELGWPADAERVDGARAAFADLLRLPAHRLAVSTFTLEADALVSPSPLIDEVERAGLASVEQAVSPMRIFEYEALGLEPVDAHPLSAFAHESLQRRLKMPAHGDPRYRGATSAHVAPAYSLSALERYLDCPFKFFAADVLRLEEAPDDQSMLSPRARGRFIHDVFQQFFEAWDARGQGTITPERLDAARELFAEVAAPLLARLPEGDRTLERTRLFGSAISLGIVDVVLGLEASRPVDVRERWLEYRLEGEFALGSPDGRRVALKGVADRIDLLAGHSLRVVDYKSGYAPNPKRALQVPVYALCAQERLGERDGTAWTVDEASYVAFSGKRSLVPVVKAPRPGSLRPADGDDPLASARQRLFDAVDAVSRGEFPPRPHDPMICRYCAYAAVCRKDYVGD